MKILNLVYPEKSNIKYKISKFPDGQQQITIEKLSLGSLIPGINEPIYHDNIQIKSRLNNFQDLELIICATKSLRALGVKEIHLYTPYFLGSRSDRQFEEGSNNYLKDVICPIINSMNFKSVTCLDSHSYVLEACLNNFKKEDNEKLVEWSLRTIWNNPNLNKFYQEYLNSIILVSPDTGAYHKIYKLAEQIGYTEDIVTCFKERDSEGKLTKCVIPGFNTDHNNKDLIIIDDICDGGNTFINIAKKIKYGAFKGKLYLIVTHGIFSKGYKELNKYFDGIYCTNSYKDIPEKEWDGDKKDILTNVKQLNIF